ncbi:MAG: sulfatase/phosphatase domain-containing protein, partial [Actinomycetota bacterium]
NYPWGWAQCGNSPFKWYKQNTHEGGVHVPLVVHWPAGIDADQRGSLRDQFTNVADIVPTIYELLGVTAPAEFNGREQLPVTGHSFAAVLADPELPATNRLQYFEMVGSRAVVAELDGTWWKAGTRHETGVPFDEDDWELYDLDADPSECHNLATDQPDRLRRMIDLWWQEAERNGVLPLDDRTWELFMPRPDDRGVHRTDHRYRYRPPMSVIPQAVAAPIGMVAWDIEAQLTLEAGDEGAIYAIGNVNSGLAVFVQNGRLVADYNAFGDHTLVESDVDLPSGDTVVTVGLRSAKRRAGVLTLSIDGEPCGHADVPLLMMMATTLGASIGEDHGSAVSRRYDAPFAFTGTLHYVDVEVGKVTPDIAAAAERTVMARQ